MGDLFEILATAMKPCNLQNIITGNTCKYCGKQIADSDNHSKYGDGTLGCSKCEKSIDAADINPWKNNNGQKS
jgi:hypothetical protein